jgi:periplasmic protein CpxP/Spy
MRNKLFTLALGCVFALGTAAAFAQDQGQTATPPGHPTRAMRDPEHQLADLTQKLNLTADQQTQIKPILVDRQQKMHELMQNQSLSQDDRRSQARTIMTDSNSKIEAVLTGDQKQKFEAMQMPRREKSPQQ